MGYKYRNDGTPDSVDSSQSDADYPHAGVSITSSDTTKKTSQGKKVSNDTSSKDYKAKMAEQARLSGIADEDEVAMKAQVIEDKKKNSRQTINRIP